jgi:hypothetical protein
LFQEIGAAQLRQALALRALAEAEEDAHHLATAADLPIEPLEVVGRPDLAPMFDGEAVVGEDVDFGLWGAKFVRGGHAAERSYS